MIVDKRKANTTKETLYCIKKRKIKKNEEIRIQLSHRDVSM